MTKKNLVQSDLDLILNKYYKERLEFQLKNGRIYTNKENLIESIILLLLIHLSIFFN